MIMYRALFRGKRAYHKENGREEKRIERNGTEEKGVIERIEKNVFNRRRESLFFATFETTLFALESMNSKTFLSF